MLESFVMFPDFIKELSNKQRPNAIHSLILTILQSII